MEDTIYYNPNLKIQQNHTQKRKHCYYFFSDYENHISIVQNSTEQTQKMTRNKLTQASYVHTQ